MVTMFGGGLITEIEILNLYCNLQVDCRPMQYLVSWVNVYTENTWEQCHVLMSILRTPGSGVMSSCLYWEHLGAFCSCWAQKHSWAILCFGNQLWAPPFFPPIIVPVLTKHRYIVSLNVIREGQIQLLLLKPACTLFPLCSLVAQWMVLVLQFIFKHRSA